MDENSNKIRTGFYLKKELLNECDCFLLHILCIDKVRKINRHERRYRQTGSNS